MLNRRQFLRTSLMTALGALLAGVVGRFGVGEAKGEATVPPPSDAEWDRTFGHHQYSFAPPRRIEWRDIGPGWLQDSIPETLVHPVDADVPRKITDDYAVIERWDRGAIKACHYRCDPPEVTRFTRVLFHLSQGRNPQVNIGQRYKLSAPLRTVQGVEMSRGESMTLCASYPEGSARLRADDGREMFVSGAEFLGKVASPVIWTAQT